MRCQTGVSFLTWCLLQLEDGTHVSSESRPGFALLTSSYVFEELGHYSVIDVPKGKEERQPYSSSLVCVCVVCAYVCCVYLREGERFWEGVIACECVYICVGLQLFYVCGCQMCSLDQTRLLVNVCVCVGVQAFYVCGCQMCSLDQTLGQSPVFYHPGGA